MSTDPECHYGVWIHETRVGTLFHRGDFTHFSVAPEYRENPNRPVLGLTFEDNLLGRHARAMRLSPWFSNLLPEGKLREWIARDRGVNVAREMELLAQVGRDLPGAVRVLFEEEREDDLTDALSEIQVAESTPVRSAGWHFSLAGVGLKFSMVRSGDRLTLPAHGEGGDWIVKLPDTVYPDVPLNEFAMMTLASKVGITVPDILLVPVDRLQQLPDRLVTAIRDQSAYAVRRFDRPHSGQRVHIEDLAQVRNFDPDRKYQGSFETVAALCYRGSDTTSLLEFVRRLTLNVLIDNGDAHLKNWSMIYADRRTPRLSPAYDIVSTGFYRTDLEDLGLMFGRSRRFEDVTLQSFDRLERKLDATGLDLAGCAEQTAKRVVAEWSPVATMMSSNAPLRDSIESSVLHRRASFS